MSQDKDKDKYNPSMLELFDHGTQSEQAAEKHWIIFLNAWSIDGQFKNAAEVKQHYLNPWLAYK